MEIQSGSGSVSESGSKKTEDIRLGRRPFYPIIQDKIPVQQECFRLFCDEMEKVDNWYSDRRKNGNDGGAPGQNVVGMKHTAYVLQQTILRGSAGNQGIKKTMKRPS
jgi:hypothetical protein